MFRMANAAAFVTSVRDGIIDECVSLVECCLMMGGYFWLVKADGRVGRYARHQLSSDGETMDRIDLLRLLQFYAKELRSGYWHDS